jgi:L-malate glycosyltransferase
LARNNLLSMSRVLFVTSHVKHYRLPFFDLLYKSLQAEGVELRVIYCDPNSAHAARKDNVDLPSTYAKRIDSYWIADRVVFQPAWREIAAADLVVTPNENK